MKSSTKDPSVRAESTARSRPARAVSARASSDDRVRRASSDDLRERLLEAALAEFSANGYEAASTRAIAARAGAHQPQINYHFESKLELWRAAVDHLMDELTSIMAEIEESSTREAMAGIIRGLVHFAAERPELNRIMIHEGTAGTERLEWIVERHVRAKHDLLVQVWSELVEAGDAAPVSPQIIHYLLVGSASLVYANAPEARMLLGVEPTDPSFVNEHAETLVRLLLPLR